ncbi:HIRAN domain-containing protein [Nocardioides sp. Y6]|uniref:HIRAN domain-containing protein n=1 Tax=Nocardioides malaquae TaxID=2773426 RepID=A0ABR9RNG5_9ACTN|nr:HIRAN domain-containing protein [Nocardioides malaquae]MBE7323112.1 HIRAN domain-containing protein [Nocardioides malaquae]
MDGGPRIRRASQRERVPCGGHVLSADEWQVFLDALARRNAEGWPKARPPRGYPVRADYLPKESEAARVVRGADGLPALRLVDAGDRLSLRLIEGGDLVNPKGSGLRAVGLVTTYARGATFFAPTFRTADLRKGRPVELRREPDNPHDRNAVALHGPGARKPFAYVQRGKAATVARRIDAGESLGGVCLWGPAPGRDDDSAFIAIGSLGDLLALLRD